MVVVCGLQGRHTSWSALLGDAGSREVAAALSHSVDTDIEIEGLDSEVDELDDG